MNATERRQRVRAWLAGDQWVFAPNVYDALSARVAEHVGFEMALLSAHGAEWMINGGSELSRVTISELAEQARRICRSSDLSLLVTGPFGFGNALNEMRYVEEMESAGVSIVTIGDVALPLRFGKRTGIDPYVVDLDHEPRVSVEEFVGKIKAARAARQDPSLVIAARSNVLMGDIPEAVRRLKAYEAAGAEAVWLTLSTPAGIEALHRATKLPLITGGYLWRSAEWLQRFGGDPEIRRFLHANGVRIASLGNTPIRAVTKTYFDTFTALRDGSHDKVERVAMSKEKFEQVTRLSQDNELIKSFLN